ncbi:MAG: hypothetical protein U9O59_04270 [Actinomycetota bacterium]|nr:hypothetical protein [Actinomycetota bacterium]
MGNNSLYILLTISIILLIVFLVIAFVFGTSILSNSCMMEDLRADGEEEKILELMNVMEYRAEDIELIIDFTD